MRLKANPPQQGLKGLLIAPILNLLIACYGRSHARLKILVNCQRPFVGELVIERLATVGNEKLNRQPVRGTEACARQFQAKQICRISR